MSLKRGRPKQDLYFAIYRGDEFLAHGPLWEMALLFDMAEKSIRELSHISHYKRVAKAPNPEKRMVAVKVEDLEADDLKIKHRRRGANNV